MSSARSLSRRSTPRVRLNEGALEMVARRFAVLGEPMRLRLIQALFAGKKHVNALVAETGGTQANISRHLQTLTQAHILSRQKEGLQVFYEIADPSIFQLCDQVCGSLQQDIARQADVFEG
ncbi:MAG: helix-turn-helix transcriptional regulator [Verrucomicrobia bacterium]|nr:helix-turn-helix transcriptional regulator [Verrucomicrobiota bacterium]